MRAAFFDMDRTVLEIDTGMSWMRFLRRRGELPAVYMARALYWSVLYKLAVLDLESLASRLVADMRGDSEAELLAKSRLWFHSDVVHRVAPRARRAIEHHRAAGDTIVLLTGATQFVAEAVGSALEMDHTLSSRIEVVDGRFTGRLEQLCFGQHKVRVAERFAQEHGVDLGSSIFYSDSYNDLPMFRRVGEAVAVNPDARLQVHARRSGWRIERWA